MSLETLSTISGALLGGALGLAIGKVFRLYELADRFWLWLLYRPPSDAAVNAYVAAILKDLENQEQT